MTTRLTGSTAEPDLSPAPTARSSGRKSPWWKKHAMDRILRCLPRDVRDEAREVLNALDPNNPTAALVYLFQEHKVEVLATAEALKQSREGKTA